MEGGRGGRREGGEGGGWVKYQAYHMKASSLPVYVASLTAANSGSNLGLKATVKAQSMILPFT